MARYSAGVRTDAGSGTLPIISLYAIANISPRIVEIGVFNTTTTAVNLVVRRLTTAGTTSGTLTAAEHDDRSPAASGSPRDTHTGAPTLGDDLGYRTTLPGVVGAGLIWTFGDTGLIIPAGTANGIGLIPVGTGQVCDAYIVWDE